MKTKTFCPKCGKEEGDFYKGFCIQCYKKMNVELKFPRKIEISECKYCGLWRVQNKWVEASYDELIKIVKKKIKSNLFNLWIEVELNESKGLMLVDLKGSLDPNGFIKITEKTEIPYKIRERTCDFCMKKGAKYFEVKLQLRRKDVFDLDKIEAVKKFLAKEVEYFKNKEHEASIFWSEELDEGTDFFFGSRRVAEKILKQLLHKYKLKAERSTKFIGLTKSGKKKVKITYCVRV